jgi:hypothetical protein
MTASEVGKEIIYLRAILRDVGYAHHAPTNIYEDNLACIAMSTNPVSRKSSRHIEIRDHFAASFMLLVLCDSFLFGLTSWLPTLSQRVFLTLFLLSIAKLWLTILFFSLVFFTSF